MDRKRPAALTLTDSYATVAIRPWNPNAGDPVICTRWDLGAPEVRVTSTPRSGADGTDETGGYLGARTVTLDLVIFGDPAGKPGGHDPYWYAEQLAAFCHPMRRPTLQISRASETSGGQTWNLALRGNPYSISYGSRAAALLEMQLNFTAPLGLLESSLHAVATSQANSATATDWHFPASFNHGFGISTGGTTVTAQVVGTAPTAPVIWINGPCANPEIRDGAGQRFKFSGLTLAAGQTVQIDMEGGTVLLADPATATVNVDADVFHTVDFAVSSFWRWLPGAHTVSYLGSGGSALVQWRDRQLTI